MMLSNIIRTALNERGRKIEKELDKIDVTCDECIDILKCRSVDKNYLTKSCFKCGRTSLELDEIERSIKKEI